jgi:hypothetical protein
MRFPVQVAVLNYTGLPKANTLLGHNTLRLIGTGDYQGTLKFWGERRTGGRGHREER